MANKGWLLSLVWAVPLLLLASPGELLMLGAAVLLHEGGHLLAFRLLGEPCPRLAPVTAGLTLLPRRPLSYRHEAIIALAGPFPNLLAAVALPLACRSPAALIFAVVQLLVGLTNLLPIGRSDGARALSALLSLLLPLRAAEGIARGVSLFFFLLLLFFLLFLLLHEGGGGLLLLLITLLLRIAQHP